MQDRNSRTPCYDTCAVILVLEHLVCHVLRISESIPGPDYSRINEKAHYVFATAFLTEQIPDFSELHRTTGDEKIDLTGRGYGD